MESAPETVKSGMRFSQQSGATAVVTPLATRRFGAVRWTGAVFVVTGPVAWWGVASATVPTLILAGLFIGFAGQVAKVCGDTLVQEWIDEGNRGRVFALYDVVINIALVSGVVFVAVLDPMAVNAGVTAAAIGLGMALSGLAYLRLRRAAVPTT